MTGPNSWSLIRALGTSIVPARTSTQPISRSASGRFCSKALRCRQYNMGSDADVSIAEVASILVPK
jgi:hypothetical protein